MSLFASSPSALRAQAVLNAQNAKKAAAASAASAATPSSTTTDTAAQARVENIQNQDNGVLGLIHTSMSGLTDFLKNLPSRKTLLGE